MRELVQRIPFPFVGYMFVLVGFGGLGLFVAAQAHGLPVAPYLGLATASAYGAGTVCFLYRRHQMRNADPTDPVLLHFDPMVPNTDRRDVARYLRTYRGLTLNDEANSAHRTPTQSSAARRHDPTPTSRRPALVFSSRRVPSAVAR